MSKSSTPRGSKSTAKPTAKSTSEFFPQNLYQRMSDDLHLTGKAERTRKGYLRAITQLARHCRQSPDQIVEDQLRRYFLHLKNERHFAYGNSAISTFTVPQELREVLRTHRRAGYEALMNASSDALIDVASATKALRGTNLGFFGVLQTWGRDPMVLHLPAPSFRTDKGSLPKLKARST